MKYSVGDLALRDRRAFVRVDFNVPIKNGSIGDETRITAALPTIHTALKQGATVVLATHLGRPKGKAVADFSVRPVAERLAALLGREVVFAEDCIGEPARAAGARAHAGSKVVLLENLRFHAGEEGNDETFAAALAELGDVYINDAFGAAHRAHASVAAIVPRFGQQAAAGLLMEKELQYLGMALGEPERPFVGILGGAKVSDKIEVIEHLLSRVDRLLIGGAMAYTFFRALGLPTGTSLVEEDKVGEAQQILAHAKTRDVELTLPVDHVVADAITAEAATAVLRVSDQSIGERKGLDIGPETVRLFTAALGDAKTVVWNGPMGVFELPPFAKGTLAVANAVAQVTGVTIVGGGDSVAAVNQAGVADRITHVSTGGGASLEFLGGHTLPGVTALPDK